MVELITGELDVDAWEVTEGVPQPARIETNIKVSAMANSKHLFLDIFLTPLISPITNPFKLLLF